MRFRFKAILVAAAFIGLASPAFAGDYNSHKHKAYERVTRDCLQYAGCQNIEFRGSSNSNGGCSLWYFTYTTSRTDRVSRSVAVQDYPVLCVGGIANLTITDYS